MMQTMTRGTESSAATGYLLVAFELSQRWWKVGFTTGMGHRVRTRRIAAGALESLAQAIAGAKQMCGVAADAPVISCYEAGRDGFWLHRYLTGRGATRAFFTCTQYAAMVLLTPRRWPWPRRTRWICGRAC
jgi:transposase